MDLSVQDSIYMLTNIEFQEMDTELLHEQPLVSLQTFSLMHRYS